jgi:proteasome accessory factor B
MPVAFSSDRVWRPAPPPPLRAGIAVLYETRCVPPNASRSAKMLRPGGGDAAGPDAFLRPDGGVEVGGPPLQSPLTHSYGPAKGAGTLAVSATERIVNLALFLASAHRPVSALEIAQSVAGYPTGQNEAAFNRMFERDKDDLRRAGLVISIDRSEEAERYRFEPDATFAETVELTPVEAMELRAACVAMLADASFPYTADLRTAIAKIVAVAGSPMGSSSAILPSASADESPETQSVIVADLTLAIAARKRARFAYTGAGGRRSDREVEPWGLFARDGRWYLVANDPSAAGERVFAVSRIRDLAVEQSRPKTPDFERPEGFDVSRFMLMPFQFGAGTHEATLRMTGAAAHRAVALTAGQGALTKADGAVVWHVPVADETLLARWIVENGPGVEAVAPDSLREALASGLRKVAERHA